MDPSNKLPRLNTILVGILAGSPNDMDRVVKASETLTALGIGNEVRVLSAHRSPDLVQKYVTSAPDRGIEVLIACAGLANHLGGAVAAQTVLPVIGVPMASSTLGGLDSLLSTVQMPPGVPVATVAIDGVKNAAYLAARILALKYPEISARLKVDMAEQRKKYENGQAST